MGVAGAGGSAPSSGGAAAAAAEDSVAREVRRVLEGCNPSDYRSVFGFPFGARPDLQAVQTKYRHIMRVLHPDKRSDKDEMLAGGREACDEAVSVVQRAMDNARRDLFGREADCTPPPEPEEFSDMRRLQEIQRERARQALQRQQALHALSEAVAAGLIENIAEAIHEAEVAGVASHQLAGARAELGRARERQRAEAASAAAQRASAEAVARGEREAMLRDLARSLGGGSPADPRQRAPQPGEPGGGAASEPASLLRDVARALEAAGSGPAAGAGDDGGLPRDPRAARTSAAAGGPPASAAEPPSDTAAEIAELLRRLPR